VADALAIDRPDLVLTVTGHGSANPVANNANDDGSDNPVGRRLNRRVTLTYGAG
jgi:outer membrane protein OmpA-like peptidoglycan-associated protein